MEIRSGRIPKYMVDTVLPDLAIWRIYFFNVE